MLLQIPISTCDARIKDEEVDMLEKAIALRSGDKLPHRCKRGEIERAN